MRRSYGAQWICLPDDVLAGIALGSDMVSEHEWGVKSIRYKFGCDDSKDGIDRRIIRDVPNELRWEEDKKWQGIFLCPKQEYYRQPKDWVDSGELSNYRDQKFGTAWDEKTFGIVAYDKADQIRLRTLWDAFQAKDIAFWTNVGVFHTGGGLIFSIVSRIPEADKEKTLKADLDYHALIEASINTGIDEELKAAGKKWYDLSPKWAKSIELKAKTKYPVVYWLNPQEQHIYNCGWFTVEQLRQWVIGAGPIPMTKRQQHERNGR
jgi:hypothetical protein